MRKPSLRNVRKSFFVVFLLLLLQMSATAVIFSGLQPIVEAVGSPVLLIDPEVSSANPGARITIVVNISNVEDLYTYAFKINWTYNLLRVVTVTAGSFLGQGGATTSFTYKSYFGHVEIANSILGREPGVSGNGTLATINLEVQMSGNSTLELFGNELLGIDTSTWTTYPIEHTLEHGYFYTTYPVAKLTFLPDPKVGPEYFGRPIVGEAVTFNASTSYDPDGGSIDTYEWDFRDGNTGTGMIATHTYTEVGEYRVRLKVTDDEGETDEREHTETFTVLTHDISILNVTATPARVWPGDMVNINVTVLNEGMPPSSQETLNVTVYYDDTPIATQQFEYTIPRPPPSPPQTYHNLESGVNGTTTISWNTTDVAPDTYTIKAYVYLLGNSIDEEAPEGIEEDLEDNTLLGNDVTILTRDLNITNVVADPIEVTKGDPVSIEVTVVNEGDFTEDFNVTAYYDNTPIETKEVADLDPDAVETLQFSWNTTDVTPSITPYTIEAEASTVANETDLNDNKRTGNAVTINAPLGYPTANFTIYWPGEPLVGEEVTFNASASEDADGDIVSYEWVFGDGTTELYVGTNLTDTATHIYTEAGNYTIVLSVTDNDDQTSSASNWTMVYALPVANFTYSPSTAEVGETVTFNATASYDPDGGNATYPSGIVSYEWDFDDETTDTGNIATHAYTESGQYNVTLTVADDDNRANSTWRLVIVGAPPVANFTYSPTEPATDQTITFDASASEDPDGGIVSYRWDFDDGVKVLYTGDNLTDTTTHTYTETGTFSVVLNVTDDDGLTDTYTNDVTVSAPALVHDVAVTSVVASPTSVTFGQSVTITVYVKNEGGFSETFDVTVYYNTTPIQTEDVIDLDPGATQRLNFTWLTSAVGSYTISATASEVTGETDTTDNTEEDGEVTISSVIPQPGAVLSIEFSGEREYFEDDDVKIRLVALVSYSGAPASNADVTMSIFDPEGEPWIESDLMIERLTGTGIYEWESNDTILELELAKGFYVVHVQAGLAGFQTSEISQFHIVAVEKTASIISIDANPTSVAAGSSIRLSGAIAPTRPGVPVVIHYRARGGTWSELRTITASSTGYYSLGWVMTTSGTYEVKASWLGDTRTEGAESEVKTVTVHGSGIIPQELLPYVMIAIAVIAGSIAGLIYFYRGQKGKVSVEA